VRFSNGNWGDWVVGYHGLRLMVGDGGSDGWCLWGRGRRYCVEGAAGDGW